MNLNEIEKILKQYDNVFEYHIQLFKGTKEDKEDFGQNIKLYFIQLLFKIENPPESHIIKLIQKSAIFGHREVKKSQNKFEKSFISLNMLKPSIKLKEELITPEQVMDMFVKLTSRERIIISAIEQEIDDNKIFFFSNISRKLGLSKHLLSYYVSNIRKKIIKEIDRR